MVKFFPCHHGMERSQRGNAKREAYNGESIEDDGQPEPIPLPQTMFECSFRGCLYDKFKLPNSSGLCRSRKPQRRKGDGSRHDRSMDGWQVLLRRVRHPWKSVGDPQLYKVVSPYRTSPTGTPDTAVSLFVAIGLDDQGLSRWEPAHWRDAYNTGDIVDYNGVLRISDRWKRLLPDISCWVFNEIRRSWNGNQTVWRWTFRQIEAPWSQNTQRYERKLHLC